MRTGTKLLMVVGIIAAIAGIGILIGWLGSRGSTSPITPVPVQPVVDSGPIHPAPTITTNPLPVMTNASSNPGPIAAPLDLSTLGTNLLADWENRVDEILTAETDDTNKVNQLLEVFPHLPEEGQVEVAQHLSNL